jgi:hypothetical protein
VTFTGDPMTPFRKEMLGRIDNTRIRVKLTLEHLEKLDMREHQCFVQHVISALYNFSEMANSAIFDVPRIHHQKR